MAWQYLKDALENWNNIPDIWQKSNAIAASAVDWELGAIFTKTLAANTTLTFSNLKLNKVITLMISGDFTLALPAGVNIISGEYDGTVDNYIQIHCVDTATPAFWAIISQEA
jgi:hypothetical protein